MADAGTPGDRVSVTVAVRLPPAAAFDLFTREIDAWWQRGPRYRNGRVSRMELEPRVGGAFVERIDEGAAQRVIEIGRITVWEPPARLEMRWRNSNFAAHEHTRLEVAFRAVGAGTHVTVRHHGWAALPPEHPARHGQQGAEFVRRMGMWWADVLRAYADRGAAAGAAGATPAP